MKDDGLRELFAKPPAEFTAARNALAKELRKKGDEDGAKRVLALRRPTAALWAANQLARRDEEDLEALVEATDRMRKMQGRGTGDDLRAAMGDQRAALARLESAAEAALREGGLSVSQSVLRTVQRTLQAAAAGDRDTREALREGRLESEQEPAGFEALLGGSAAPAARGAAPAYRGAAPAARPKRAAGKASKGEQRKEAAEARRREKEAAKEEARRKKEVAREDARREREVKAAEALVEKLERKAAEADRAANEARDRAREARNKLHELRSRL
jgi:hypothetical protein